MKSIMKSDKLHCIIFSLLLPFFVIAPLIIRDTQFQHFLIMLLLFATLSQAWNLVGGYAGQLSFGHAAFFGIGAYAALAPLKHWGLTPWIGMLIGGITAALLAVVISRRLFLLAGNYFAIATFAVAEVLRELFTEWDWVDGPVGLDAPILKQGFYNFMFYETKLPYHYTALAFFITIMSLVYIIERSRMGYYFRAIKQSQNAAEALGVNTSRYKQYSLILSAFFTAICGSFYAQYVLHIEPSTVLSLSISIKIVLITALGGSGTLWGPLLGSAVLIPLQEYSRIWLGGTGKGIDLILFGTLIIIICLFEPKGMVGLMRRISSQNGKG